MNTPAHLLVGLAICARRDKSGTGRMAALGGVLPDLSLYLMAGVSLFVFQIPPSRVFGDLYFSPAWQSVFAVDNSFVIWGLAFAVALGLRSVPAIVTTGAGLLHLATDFALHHDDARQHFWPLSDWVFESPLSYWDSLHHVASVAPLTLCLAKVWVVRQWLLFF